MKKIYLMLAFLLGGLGWSYQSTAQTSELFGESWGWCDSVFTYMGYDDYEPGMHIVTYWGDGDSTERAMYPDGSSTYASSSDAHFYTSLGTYTIRHVLYDTAGALVDTFQYYYTSGCKTIVGYMYKDVDADCASDFSADDILSFPVWMEIKKDGVPMDTFMTYGYLYYEIPSPDYSATYTISPIDPYGYINTCPAAGYYDFEMGDLTSSSTFNFGFECNPAETTGDMATYAYGFYRFVDTSFISITAAYASCYTTDALLTLQIDPEYKYAGVYAGTATPTSISTDEQTVTWELPALNGSEYLYVQLVPVGEPDPGTMACSYVRISGYDGTYGAEVDTVNNTYGACDSIRSSFDPNAKSVSPAGDIAAGELLTYTIQFENMGNDTAFNIHIMDTLSAHVDASTFTLLNSTHPVNITEKPHGSSKIIKFDFPRIKLADKSSPEANKGAVTYSVKAKSSLPLGTEILNTAFIYFDINPAVVTNTVNSLIPNPTSIEQISKLDGISLFPNPATTAVTIENKGDFTQVFIVNTLGQVLQSANLNKGLNTISISELSAGVYYTIFSGAKGSKSAKLVKH